MQELKDEMKSYKPIRILIADDHPVVREGLSAILNGQPDMEVVTEAGNGAEAAEQFVRHLPDITLLDLRMPGLDGIATVSKIRSRFPAAKIVILSAYEGEEEVCNAILAGVEGFMSKDSPRKLLMECIRQVHAGGKWIPSAIASRLAHRVATPELERTGVGGSKPAGDRQKRQRNWSGVACDRRNHQTPRQRHSREVRRDGAIRSHRGSRQARPRISAVTLEAEFLYLRRAADIFRTSLLSLAYD